MVEWEKEFKAPRRSNFIYRFSLRRFFKFLLILIAIILVIGLVAFCLRFFSSEDTWIKTDKGLWIRHGNPTNIPLEVQEQQNALTCAGDLYADANIANMTFSSQCLGTCDFGSGYSVDLVNVPRNSQDNLKENQCSDYLEGKTKHFIELNSQGNLVRVE